MQEQVVDIDMQQEITVHLRKDSDRAGSYTAPAYKFRLGSHWDYYVRGVPGYRLVLPLCIRIQNRILLLYPSAA